MGVEYALVDDANKRYAHLGKKTWDESGPVSFQISPKKLMKFIARSHEQLRLVADSSAEWDDILDKGYSLVEEWCDHSPGHPRGYDVAPYKDDCYPDLKKDIVNLEIAASEDTCNQQCSQCGSRHVRYEYDHDDDGTLLQSWRECEDCGKQWS